MSAGTISLPDAVQPGDLITADLLNAILSALRGYQSSDERFTNLARRLTELETRINRIEALIADANRKNNDLSGLVDHLRIDRDQLFARFDDLSATVLPDIRKRFDDIEINISKRFDPIEQRITNVELKQLLTNDPIERLPNMNADYISRLHQNGFQTVNDLKNRNAELSAILGDDIEAQRISTMIGHIQTGQFG